MDEPPDVAVDYEAARMGKGDGGWSDDNVFKRTGSAVEKFSRPRDPEASPLHQIVREHFDEFVSSF